MVNFWLPHCQFSSTPHIFCCFFFTPNKNCILIALQQENTSSVVFNTFILNIASTICDCLYKLLCFQLDEVKSEDDKAFVSDFISSVFDKDRQSKAALSIIIFASPETLIKDVWFTMFQYLIELNALNLKYIDEVHLYVDFGLTFQKSFCSLKDKVYASLIDKDYNKHYIVLKVPALFMTVTFNVGLISLLQ
jgi:hypothetical protein